MQLSLRLKPQCHLKYLGPLVQKEMIGSLNWAGEVQPTLYIFIIETEWSSFGASFHIFDQDLPNMTFSLQIVDEIILLFSLSTYQSCL